MVLLLLLLLFSHLLAHAQTQFEITPEVDRLLRNGLNKMYRYDLKEADESFDELVRRFPEHPIGYMHKAEVVWWHALRDNKNPKLEADFERYTDLAINKGDNLLKKNPKELLCPPLCCRRLRQPNSLQRLHQEELLPGDASRDQRIRFRRAGANAETQLCGLFDWHRRLQLLCRVDPHTHEDLFLDVHSRRRQGKRYPATGTGRAEG